MSRHGNRRQFLQQLGAGVLATGAAPVLGVWPARADGGGRAPAGIRYGLELEGRFAGWVHQNPGSAGSPLSNGMIIATCGVGMSRDFYQWLKDSLNLPQPSPKSGALLTVDPKGQTFSRTEWDHALLSEAGLPALDAASTDPASLSIRIAPDVTRTVENLKETLAPANSFTLPNRRKWLVSGFALSIDGLNDECAHASRVGSLVLRPQSNGATASYPMLVVTVPEAHSQGFSDWHAADQKQGNSSMRTGTLRYLASNTNEALFTISFPEIECSGITVQSAAPGSGGGKSITVQMICKSVQFDYGSAWT